MSNREGPALPPHASLALSYGLVSFGSTVLLLMAGSLFVSMPSTGWLWLAGALGWALHKVTAQISDLDDGHERWRLPKWLESDDRAIIAGTVVSGIGLGAFAFALLRAVGWGLTALIGGATGAQ